MPNGNDAAGGESRTAGQRRFGFALMAIAGWCDAAGFMLFAQLYVSFMSGDATQLGLKLGQADWSAALKYLAAQALFVLGAVAGRFYLTGERPTRRGLLAVNAALLAATAVLGARYGAAPGFVCAVLAMGAQNAVLTHEAGIPIGTMITGALARLGLSLADRLRGRPGAVGDNFAQWAFFVAGAVGGTLAFGGLHAASFAPAAAATALLIPFAGVLKSAPSRERPQAPARTSRNHLSGGPS